MDHQFGVKPSHLQNPVQNICVCVALRPPLERLYQDPQRCLLWEDVDQLGMFCIFLLEVPKPQCRLYKHRVLSSAFQNVSYVQLKSKFLKSSEEIVSQMKLRFVRCSYTDERQLLFTLPIQIKFSKQLFFNKCSCFLQEELTPLELFSSYSNIAFSPTLYLTLHIFGECVSRRAISNWSSVTLSCEKEDNRNELLMLN